MKVGEDPGGGGMKVGVKEVGVRELGDNVVGDSEVMREREEGEKEVRVVLGEDEF